jgi:hypothetical protein
MKKAVSQPLPWVLDFCRQGGFALRSGVGAAVDREVRAVDV